MIIDYGMGEKEIACSVYTAVLYEQEFGKELIADYFGDQKVRQESDDDGFVLRFSESRFNEAMKVLWACEKTVDDKVPPFSRWAKEVSGINIFEVNLKLEEIVADAFFRTKIEDSEEK